ncbi:MAG: hypothetical protein SGPRY_000601 [Prymnesium sp.]
MSAQPGPRYTREETLDGERPEHSPPRDSAGARQLADLPPPPSLAVLYDLSQLLQTGLDRETLSVLVDLTETGVNPEALAAVVHELRRESAALHAAKAADASQMSSAVANR